MASIKSIAQSEDGYIWIGTDGGPLMRYNGSDFEEIIVEDGDNNHHAANLYLEADTVYFASQYKGYFAYIPKEHSYINIDLNHEKTGDAIALLKVKQTFVFVSDRGIYHSKKGSAKQLYKRNDFNNRFNLYSYARCESGILLFTSEGNFWVTENTLIPLDKAIGTTKEIGNNFRFATIIHDKITLLNSTGDHWLEFSIDSKGNFVSKREFDKERTLSENEEIISLGHHEKLKNTVALTNKGNLFHIKEKSLHRIAHNYNQPLIEAQSIICDVNGDYWISSTMKGMYKVSLEAFTKLQMHPIQESPDIMFPFETIYNDIFISLFSGKTYVGAIHKTDFEEFNFNIKSVALWEGDYYVATNIGVKKFIPGDNSRFEDVYFKNENVTFILADQGYLWAGVAGKGIIRINVKTGEQLKLKDKNENVPNYFYTGQIIQGGKKIYFGTNNGVFSYNKKSQKIDRVKLPSELGSYSGCSTKDVYGTVWFTMEKGIVGFTPKSETKVLWGNENFNTNLYYTLNSDRLGNLIIGTNKGLTIVKIDRNGEVTSKSHYDSKSGFGGYETHMRSQFQNDNSIFVGTVEGLFLINTNILDQLKTPLPPIITDLTRYDINGSDHNNSFHFKFHVNNPKSGTIQYVYRLKGQDDSWKKVTDDNIIHLYNLGNGDYTLEVKASYDGINFSDVSFQEIHVTLPIWKTNWFIILVVLCILGVNVLIINYSRAFDSNLIQTKDMEVHIKLAPSILLFGIIAVLGAHIAASFFNTELPLNIQPLMVVGFGLATMYFISRSFVNTKNETYLNRILLAGVILILLHFYYEMYMTRLHPFHILGIAVTTMVVPYFLNRLKSMIIFTSFLLFCTVIIVLVIDNPVYPKSYFIIAQLSLIAVLIFSSFLRSDSIEKLIFISSIINKGNIPALAFDNEGKIVYASENISKFIPATHDEILHEDISTLNNHVPFDGRYKDVDVVHDFIDGKKYLVPMVNGESEIHWLEWEYKKFSKDIHVMLGQDVTVKMELENTYELLVQNAEDFIYRCDTNGNFLFLNNISFSKLGYSKEELIDTNMLNLVPVKFKDEISKYLADHFDQRKKTSYKEFPIVKKNGEVIWVGQYITTLYAAGSSTHINGFLALARDVTEIRHQQKLIKDQRDDITASINYAQRIQYNLLPHERVFNSGFKEHFIIYKPKDIVSGDFYWIDKVGDLTILALADCTGHGVPGSFMTLLGINLLNSVINENRHTDPGEILNELDRKLTDTLTKGTTGNVIRDGMEITVCVFDEKSDELAFACAGSRFLIFENESFTMLKGDNKHIGDDPTPGFTGYNTHYANFTSDNQLYLFTDGMQDQFGGPNDKKFSFRRILEIFESSVSLPLIEQRIHIEEEFNEWITDGDQTDDVTIISLKKNIR
jgi:PAS domain S-box-containing protein